MPASRPRAAPGLVDQDRRLGRGRPLAPCAVPVHIAGIAAALGPPSRDTSAPLAAPALWRRQRPLDAMASPVPIAGVTATFGPAPNVFSLPTVTALARRIAGPLYPVVVPVGVTGQAASQTPLAGSAELLTVGARSERSRRRAAVGALIAITSPVRVAGATSPARPLTGSTRVLAVAAEARRPGRARVQQSRRLSVAAAPTGHRCPQGAVHRMARRGADRERQHVGDIGRCRASANRPLTIQCTDPCSG
jgi:hypothetical protein